MTGSLEEHIEARVVSEMVRDDAIALATAQLGVDTNDVIDGFVWVAYPGSTSGVRVHVFPRPIDARAFFDRVDSSILDRLAHRPSKGVRSAPSIRTHHYEKRPNAAYLSLEVLSSDVDAAEKASRLEKTGASRLFVSEPRAGDLVSRSFDRDAIDRYVPQGSGSPSLVSSVERFVRIDRFGTQDPGDLDILVDPFDAAGRFPGVQLAHVTPRGFICSIRGMEYRLRTVELVRDGLVDDHWYVDAHDVLRAIGSYARR